VSIANLVRRLTEAGAPPEAIAIAVEAVEGVHAVIEAKKAKDAERKRAERAAKREISSDRPETVQGPSMDAARTVQESPDQTSPLVSPLLPSPEPLTNNPPIIPPSEKITRDRATTLPPDWTVPSDWLDWAEAEIGPEGQRMTAARVAAEAAKFPDYWRSKPRKDATKTNWKATWRNWIRNALERMPPIRRGADKPANVIPVTLSDGGWLYDAETGDLFKLQDGRKLPRSGQISPADRAAIDMITRFTGARAA